LLRSLLDCNRITLGKLKSEIEANSKLSVEKHPPLDAKKAADCKNALTARREWAEKTFLDSTAMSFPGGFPKIEESDLGVIGQVGLLLILAWLFYTVRRENHALQSFVDIDKDTRRVGKHFPSSFIIEPQDEFFSAEHIATLHVFFDLLDLIAYDWVGELSVRFVAELFLLIGVWVITISILRYVIDSSILLNGWYLASKLVWVREWDENTDEPASKVHVDLERQTAVKVSN
jgi:hypothetical protein